MKLTIEKGKPKEKDKTTMEEDEDMEEDEIIYNCEHDYMEAYPQYAKHVIGLWIFCAKCGDTKKLY